MDNSVDFGDRWKKARKNPVEKSKLCGRKIGNKRLPKILTESDNTIFVNFLHELFSCIDDSDSRAGLDILIQEQVLKESIKWLLKILPAGLSRNVRRFAGVNNRRE